MMPAPLNQSKMTKPNPKIEAFKAAFPYSLPVMVGYVVLGIAFGIILIGKGFSWWLAPVMGLLIYAGSMQFVAVDLLSAVFNPFQIIIMTLTVNARHLFYGISMLDKFRSMGTKKPYMIFSLTDETYSLLCSAVPPKQADENWFYFFISLLDQIYWITGCTIGAIGGSFLHYDTTGIDFAMTALFIVIMVEQWESTSNHLPVITGIIVSIMNLILFGPKNFIIPSMVVIFLALVLFPKKFKSEISS